MRSAGLGWRRKLRSQPPLFLLVSCFLSPASRGQGEYLCPALGDPAAPNLSQLPARVPSVRFASLALEFRQKPQRT